MIRYQLIESDSHDGLAECVQEFLAKGWTLQGGVAGYVDSGEGRDGPWTAARYVQAVVSS